MVIDAKLSDKLWNGWKAGLDESDLGITIYSGALEAVYTQFGVVLTN